MHHFLVGFSKAIMMGCIDFERKSGVTYSKDNKTKHASDLKRIARISMMVLYLGYSFEMCNTCSFDIFEISYTK